VNNYDVEVQWLINDVCNFSCEYCWLQREPKVNRSLGLRDMQRVIEGFNNKGFTWLVHMSGGEPFLFPNFVELCRGLIKNHFISVNTNLSHKDIRHFSQIINPEKVKFVHASLHIMAREQIKGIKQFINNYKIIKNAGFNIFVSYLIYPSLLGRFKKDYDFFKSQGVIIHPKVFRGDYYGILDSMLIKRVPGMNRFKNIFKKTYPNSYTAKEKKLIKHCVDQSVQDETLTGCDKDDLRDITIDLSLDKILVEGSMSFKGRRCSAGRTVLKMEKDGGLYRCSDEPQYYLGNMFSSPIKLLKEDFVCKAEICSCPYVGMRCVVKGQKMTGTPHA
jgi:sulfatase maturation enzyme AslB (radical SAM superfamily)